MDKQEARKWTQAELVGLIKRLVVSELDYGDSHERELVKSIAEDVQTEADMQAAWNKDLLKRNEEMQAAIDEVVRVSRDNKGNPYRPWQDARVPTHDAVTRLLEPLISESMRPTRKTGPGVAKP